jgi:molybdate transport system substrate-binding protein
MYRAAVLTMGLIAFSAPLTQGASAAEKIKLSALAAPANKAAFGAAVAAYEKSHPDIVIDSQYAGTKIIAAQIEQGAVVDVVLIATSSATGELANYLDSPVLVLKNHTAVAVTKSAAGKIHDAKDLIKPGIRIGAGTTGSVTYSFEADTVANLSKAYGKDYATKYAANVVATRTDSGKLMALLADNSIDAAIVYHADIEPGNVVEVTLPADAQVVITFSAAAVKNSQHAAAAKEFAAWLAGSEAAAIYKTYHHDPK